MSPEQKENPESVSYQADIFSLGIITYELILGKLSRGIIQPSLLPKGLRKIIEKTLKENYQNRYKSIVDFITDISEYLKEEAEKTKDSEEVRDEIIKALEFYQETLLPSSFPSWPQIEISFAKEKGTSITGTYLDFFKLEENLYIVILAEPKNTGIYSLNYTSMLRGMIKASIHFFLREPKDTHLTYLISKLNQALFKDSIKQAFTASILMLDPTKSKFVFSSCGYDSTIKIEKDSKNTFSLFTPNPLLGEDFNASFVETSGNWNVGDKLMLSSLDVVSTKEKILLLKETIKENSIYPSKIQIKKIMEKIKTENKTKRSKVLVLLERSF